MLKLSFRLVTNKVCSNLLSKKMSGQACFELASGARMPAVGLGTWQMESEGETIRALEIALDTGYRLIDTALGYGNEKVIGDFLKKKFDSGVLKREDLFIITKLPGVYLGSRERVRRSFERSFTNLGLDYIDLYMIHSPFGQKLKEDETLSPMGKDGNPDWEHLDLLATWQAMEELVDEGKVKSLGVSNVNSEQITRIHNISRHPICNLQVECNAYFAQTKLTEFCKEKNITLTAYAPLGSPGRPARVQAEGQGYPLQDEVVCKIAQKYNKSPAQVLLRNLIQRGIAVVPKSANPARIKENFQVFDFTLNNEEMDNIANLDRNVRVFHFRHLHGLAEHPEYPFNIPF